MNLLRYCTSHIIKIHLISIIDLTEIHIHITFHKIEIKM